MADTQKSFPLYISRWWPITLTGGVAFLVGEILINIGKTSFHEIAWWHMLPLMLSAILLFFIIWFVVTRMIPLILQHEPELIFTEHGINIYRLGFVPWNQIQKIKIYHMGRQKDLVLMLTPDSTWQPVQQQTLGVSRFYQKIPRLRFLAFRTIKGQAIVIDYEYLQTSRQHLISIYQELMKTVPQLQKIDHSEL